MTARMNSLTRQPARPPAAIPSVFARVVRPLRSLLLGRRPSRRRLAQTIEAHQLWFSSRQRQGARAILSGAHLKGVSLAETDLRGADLSRADLRLGVLNQSDLRE